MIHYKALFFLVVLSLLISCNSNSKDGYLNVDEFQIRKGKSLSAKDWHCYNVQYDRVCCPINWEPVQQNKSLFFSQIGDNDMNTFFVVLRYDSSINKITLEDYLREGYLQLRNDTMELFKEYSLKELVFDDKKAFYGEFITAKNGSSYITFGMYTYVNGMIYDLSLKVSQSEREVFYEKFQDILYNYKANGKYIFSEKDELNSFRFINLPTF